MAMTSTIVRNIVLGDTRSITEEHVDGGGRIHVWTYETALDTDTTALLTEHSTSLSETLAAQELEILLNA